MSQRTLSRFEEKSAPNGKVDRENRVIYGVSIITANREALGHFMYIDETTVDQVVEQGASFSKGIKARFDHPNPCEGSFGTELGRFKNFRREGEKAVADLYLNESADNGKVKNAATYVMDLAEEDSDQFATSIVFEMAEAYTPKKEDYTEQDQSDENVFWYPHARVKNLTHVDTVNQGAANDGLFSNGLEMSYLSLKMKQFTKDNPELFRDAFKAVLETNSDLLEETVKSLQSTPKSKSMSLLEKLTGLGSNAELKEALEALELSASEKEATIAELTAKVAELSSDTNRDELSTQLTSLTEEVVTLKQSNQDITEQLADSAASLTSANAQLAELGATQETVEGDDNAGDPNAKPKAQLSGNAAAAEMNAASLRSVIR